MGKDFKVLTTDPWGFIEGSYVKVHSRRAGVVGQEMQAMGKPVRATTKIHLAVYSCDLPVKFEITGVE